MGARSAARLAPSKRSGATAGRAYEAEARGLRRRAAQVERLVKLGSFEADLDTGALAWSPGMYAIFGHDSERPVTVEDAFAFFDADARREIERRMDVARRTGEAYDITVPFRLPAGQQGWARIVAQVERVDGSVRLVGVLRDITHERAAEERLRLQANQDALTGMPNRRAFEVLLGQAVADNTVTALCLVDVDRFKWVNDVHGHTYGDALLKKVAARLRGAVRTTDLVARLGGDEFAVVLRGASTRTEVTRIMAAVVAAVRLPFSLDGVTLTPTVSVGASLGTGEVATDALLKRADLALYQAKAAGRDQACLYRASLRRPSRDHDRLLEQVRVGLSRGQFEAHYQPIVDLRTHVVRGWEALVRWRHPSKGLLVPGRFLPALQDPGTSVAIDDFMLDEGLRQMRQWLDADVPVTCVGVNVSGAQLRRPGLYASIVALLERHRLTPDRLKLEVLETALVERCPDEVAATLDKLARFGVVSALDDFGTGYASLTHLRTFRVERIKLDRSFVANLGTSLYDQAIVRCMIALGSDLGLRVTAEGIETAEQLDVLRRMGCDCGQGYLFGRPLHPDDVPGFLARWHAGRAEQLLGDRAGRPSLRVA